MQYSVLDDGAPVSPGGIAGVLVGCAVFAGALYWGVRWFHHRRRRAREFESMKAELHSPIGADPGSSVVPTSRYAPFDDISLVEKSEEVREAQLRRYSGLKPMATGSSRGQQPKLVHTRSQGAFSICRTPVEMYGKVEPPWGIPRGHGQSFRNPKDDTTIRAPIWHAMSTRSPESAGTSNNVHRQFHGVPELCTPVPLYRQPAMIDRPRAAYQYRRDDLTKGHRI
ncbi:hypothetical protein C8A00DRAFT_35999 [Chaetomidium leptoderma]|uniref:Uncharacterized protein n=1 Tax=Chaetomidium leptoderma TaxID=669021 RepID=A0AAN6VI99_9PEZI|nr:hypothetical protein C8A00DRAFT_35999 [Chaetomidium leptoderma]